jgi:hypothetical protein
VQIGLEAQPEKGQHHALRAKSLTLTSWLMGEQPELLYCKVTVALRQLAQQEQALLEILRKHTSRQINGE